MPGRCCKDLAALGFASSLPVLVVATLGAQEVADDRVQGAGCTCGSPDGKDFMGGLEVGIRGSTSAKQAKKPLALHIFDLLPDANMTRTNILGGRRTPKLVGLPGDSRFVTIAPETDDPSMGLMTSMGVTIGRQTGRYASRYQPVEVFLIQDGKPLSLAHYQGIYVVMEKATRGKDRVDIKGIKEEKVGEDVTGGWLMVHNHNKKTSDLTVRAPPQPCPLPATGTEHASFEACAASAQSLADFTARSKLSDIVARRLDWVIEEPGFEETTVEDLMDDMTAAKLGVPRTWGSNSSTTAQRAMFYIYNFLGQVESSLTTPGGNWRSIVDEPAFIDYLLGVELTKNPDAYRGSTFIHKDAGGKLMMGPMWDYNEAYGINNYPIAGGTTKATWASGGGMKGIPGWRFLVCEDKDRCKEDPMDGISMWYRAVWKNDPQFRINCALRWSELRNPATGGFSDQFFNDFVDKWTATMTAPTAMSGIPATPVERNAKQWASVLKYKKPALVEFQTQVTYLRTFIIGRLAWMDKVLALGPGGSAPPVFPPRPADESRRGAFL